MPRLYYSDQNTAKVVYCTTIVITAYYNLICVLHSTILLHFHIDNRKYTVFRNANLYNKLVC